MSGGGLEVIRTWGRVFFEPDEDRWHVMAQNRLVTGGMQQVDEEGNPVSCGDQVPHEELGAAPPIDLNRRVAGVSDSFATCFEPSAFSCRSDCVAGR